MDGDFLFSFVVDDLNNRAMPKAEDTVTDSRKLTSLVHYRAHLCAAQK